MNLIDGNRRMQGTLAFPLLHPVMIGPLVFEIPHQGGGAWRFLMQATEWVCLVHHMPVMPRNDVILVNGTLGDPGNKPLPNARTLASVQRMRIFVPPVEAANDGHGTRVRRPDAEVRAGLTLGRSQMGAQLFISAVMAP